jgi:hypothetical protein
MNRSVSIFKKIQGKRHLRVKFYYHEGELDFNGNKQERGYYVLFNEVELNNSLMKIPNVRANGFKIFVESAKRFGPRKFNTLLKNVKEFTNKEPIERYINRNNEKIYEKFITHINKGK